MRNGEEWVLQGVREVYELKRTGISKEQTSKLVLIGEALQKNDIEQSLLAYIYQQGKLELYVDIEM